MSATRPVTPAVAVDELAALRAENLRLREALEFYAGHRDGKWDEWHVCDSYSGAGALFDWNGDTQDDPWEVARKALAATPAPAVAVAVDADEPPGDWRMGCPSNWSHFVRAGHARPMCDTQDTFFELYPTPSRCPDCLLLLDGRDAQ